MDTEPHKISKLRGRIDLLEELYQAGAASVLNTFSSLQQPKPVVDVSYLVGLQGKIEKLMELNSKLLGAYREYTKALEGVSMR